MMALGKNIRTQRERLGWTLEELSEKSGVDVGTIHALEARNSGRSKYAPAISRALGFTVEQLSDEDFDWKAVAPEKRWPFQEIDEAKLRALPDRDLTRIETALIVLANSFDIDIKVNRPKEQTEVRRAGRPEAA